jgi:hypothetical protein
MHNGVRYPRVGGRGQTVKAGKTQSQKKACKPRRLPHFGCTLCWALVEMPIPCLVGIFIHYPNRLMVDSLCILETHFSTVH